MPFRAFLLLDEEQVLRAAQKKRSAGTVYYQTLAGVVTSSGSLTGKAWKVLVATLTLSGVILRLVTRNLSGGVGSSGSAFKRFPIQTPAGAVTSSGVILKRSLKPFAGAVTSTGTIVRKVNKVLIGAVTSSGAIIRLIKRNLYGNSDSPGGSTSNATSRVGSRVLGRNGSDYWGAQGFQVADGLLSQFTVTFNTNSGTPSGVMNWSVCSDVSNAPGTVLSSGSFTPVPSAVNTINVSGGYHLLANTQYWLKLQPNTTQLTATYWTWDYSNNNYALGTGYDSVNTNLGTIDFLFSLTTIPATYFFTGALAKQTQKFPLGAVTSAGAFRGRMNKVLTAALASVGVMTLGSTNSLSLAGTVTSSGSLVKQTLRSLAGAVTSAGIVLRKILKLTSGAVTSSGALVSFKVILLTLSGTLTLSGVLNRQVAKVLVGVISLFSASYRERVLQNSNVIGYWPLNDQTGTTAVNLASSGSTYDGSYLNGPVLSNVAGPVTEMGSAPTFDGTNDIVRIANISNAGLSNTNGTIGFWFKPTSSTYWANATTGRLMGMVWSGGNGLYISKTAANTLAGVWGGATVTKVVTITTAWNHVAASWDSSAGLFTLYLNGVQVAQQTGIAAATGTVGSTAFSIGGYTIFFPGVIEHFVLYSTTLTATDVTALALTAPSGLIKFTTHNGLAGTVTLAGVLIRQTLKALAGAVTSSGVVTGVKVAVKVLTGAVASSGILLRLSIKRLTGAVTLAGALIAKALKVLVGAVPLSGAIIRQSRRMLAGVLTLAAVIAKQAARAQSASLPLVGALTRRANKFQSAGVPLAGALQKRAARAFSGALTLSGALVAISAIQVVLAGAVTLSGSLIRRVYHGLSAAVAPAGSLIRQIRRSLSGAVTLTGVALRTFIRLLAGTVSASGSLTRRALKSLTAAVTPSGGLVRQIIHLLSGSVTSAAGLARQIRRILVGSAAAAGILSTTRNITRILSGSASANGALVRRTTRLLQATIAPAGTVVKRMTKRLAASVSFVGGLIQGILSRLPHGNVRSTIQLRQRALPGLIERFNVTSYPSEPRRVTATMALHGASSAILERFHVFTTTNLPPQ